MKTYMKTMENRKELVKRLSQLAGIKAEYTKMPRCAFLIGDYAVERDGTLVVPEDADIEPIETLLSERMIREYDPEAEAREAEERARREAEENREPEPEAVRVSFPLAEHSVRSVRNLAAMICSRGRLISRATGGKFSCTRELVDELSNVQDMEELKNIMCNCDGITGLTVTAEAVCFTGFPKTVSGNSRRAFTQLADLMNRLSIEQGRVLLKEVDDSNEKFSFRIWLLSLGMKGEEYSTARRVLLAPLSGNTAFRTPEIEARFRENQRAKRIAERSSL